MSPAEERALRLREVMGHSGWSDIQAMASDRVKECEDALLGLMGSRPEELTGKKAIRLASRRKAILDFMDDLKQTQKLINPQPQGAGTK